MIAWVPSARSFWISDVMLVAVGSKYSVPTSLRPAWARQLLDLAREELAVGGVLSQDPDLGPAVLLGVGDQRRYLHRGRRVRREGERVLRPVTADGLGAVRERQHVLGERQLRLRVDGVGDEQVQLVLRDHLLRRGDAALNAGAVVGGNHLDLVAVDTALGVENVGLGLGGVQDVKADRAEGSGQRLDRADQERRRLRAIARSAAGTAAAAARAQNYCHGDGPDEDPRPRKSF